MRREPPRERADRSGDGPVRVAMWSGPRNLSTAMMRAWESRGDTHVVDEPLYGYYLAATGLPHPGREEVLAAMPTDWELAVARLLGPIPGGKPILFQKHMAHHLLDDVGRDWLGAMRHFLLIRHPREVVASYAAAREEVTLPDLGYERQVELVEALEARTGRAPAVVDAADVLRDPALVLSALCEALGVPWSPRMLSWAPGLRPTDGVWAPYWYRSVLSSTGFTPWQRRHRPLAPDLERVVEAAQPFYDALYARRLSAPPSGSGAPGRGGIRAGPVGRHGRAPDRGPGGTGGRSR